MMLGGHIHERVILESLDRALRERGAETSRQVPVRYGGKIGFVDLVARLRSEQLAIEAEMTARRAAHDLYKAAALEATRAWIVVPNHRVARSVRRKLQELGMPDQTPWICVLTLGQALQRVANCFP
jgi:hypothetical protein